ncbi:hypothetical protein CBS101457_006877 [Exobasidium rhododendri]|nr:hypothetical protein CBS101457_006877 [Exobasidium rhododendri]
MNEDNRKNTLKGSDGNGADVRKKASRSSQACVHCQHLKMKCSGSFPCVRCIRVGKECKVPLQVVRQPWSRKKDVQIEQLTTRLEEMERERNRLSDGSGGSASTSSSVFTTGMTPQSSSYHPLQPESTAQQIRPRVPFVSSGHITLVEASDLFDLFMHNCVLHVGVIDPEWNTFVRVKRDCPFLFACIIYVASTYSRERLDLREELREEMDVMIGNVITKGEKSVSIVQGFLFLYFFNTPPPNAENDTSWLYSGIAIRLASELNLGCATRLGKESERDRVNRERTWIMMFIVDRSLCTTRGKAWTIRDDDDLIRSSDTWCDKAACIPSDISGSMFADLLKLTSRQIDTLNTTLFASDVFENPATDCEGMMRSMNEELRECKRRWEARGAFTSPLDHYQQQGSSSAKDDLHIRIGHYLCKQLAFRHCYAVLVLNCFGLQYCASHPERTISARGYCLTQAMQAAQGLVLAAKDGLEHSVTYSPHSQCTIIIFGIVSLIKLASLAKRDDPNTSQRLVHLVEVGIDFLESIAFKPTHVTARSASFLRGLLKRSQSNGAATILETKFRPGMELHHIPPQSSRPSSPGRRSMRNRARKMTFTEYQQQRSHHSSLAPPNFGEDLQPLLPPIVELVHCDTPPSNIVDIALPWPFEGAEGLDLPTNIDPALLFGTEGSIDFGGMTIDELLDDSFWLKLPTRNSIRA